MRRLLWLALSVCLAALPLHARERAWGFCSQGGTRVYVSNVGSAWPPPSFAPSYFQQSYPNCIVTVYLTGTTTPATIYSDNSSTPLTNPFTANSNGYWEFYADKGRYDVRLSGASIPTPFTLGDVQLCDVATETCSIGGGGGIPPHNLLSPTHTDTTPYTPPVLGDLIYGASTGLWTRFPGNTTTNDYCLHEIGDGTGNVVSITWAACSAGSSTLTIEHNTTVVGTESALNFSDTPSTGTPVTFEVSNTAGVRNTVAGYVTLPPGVVPPPPFALPAGQTMAWAFPTTCAPSPAASDSLTWGPKASYICGTTSGTLIGLHSGVANQLDVRTTWSGFQMPTLPGDAVIQNIYPVAIANRSYTPAMITGLDISCSGDFLYGPGGFTQFGSTYLTSSTSIGSTAAAVTGASCYTRLRDSFTQTGHDAVNTQFVALAIYYTTATPPVQNYGIFFSIPYYGSISGVVPAFTTVADGTPISWDLAGNFISNGVVVLNHATPTRALNVSNLQNGGVYNLAVIQDATGGAALTLGTGCTWYVNNVATTTLGLATTASGVQEFSWIYDGTRCFVDTTAGGSGGASGFAYLGTWSGSTAYITNNIVSLSGSSYIALSPNSGIQPGTDGGVTWAVLAAAGAQGPAGPSGLNGTNGTDGAPGAPGYSPNQILSGCGVAYASGLTFNVSACSYIIQGTTYGSAAGTATLATADPSLDRIDAIVVNTSGAIAVITGTPAGTPAPPSIDISSQLQLTFAYVAAGATTPSNIVTTDIYHENAEWTCAGTTHVNCASTSNPHSGAVDIEWTSSVSGNNVTLTIPSGTIDLATRNNLVFWIRSKATWPSTTSVIMQWFNGTTAKCTPVALANGNFGFSSSNISGYQQIVVPTSLFSCNGIPVTRIRFQQASTTTLTGFYLDDVILQGGVASSSGSAAMNWKGAWLNSTAYAVNDTVTYQNLTYTAIQANTNLTPSTAPGSWSVHSFSVAGVLGNLQYNAGTNQMGALNTSVSGSDIVFPGAVSATQFISTDTINNSQTTYLTGSSGDSTCPTPVAGSDFLCNQSNVLNLSANGAAYSPVTTQAKTARTCAIIIGSQGGSALTTSDIQPQGSQCYADVAMTVQTIIVKVDAGNSTVQLGYSHSTGGAPTVTDYTSGVMTPATVTNITGNVVCANAAGTAITLNGVSVTCGTLATQTWNAGDTIGVYGGAADATTKRISIFVTATVN